MRLVALVLMSGLAFGAQQTQQGANDQHAAGVDRRGDHEMGFSHEKTAHHFSLLSDGGSIEVVSNDPKDAASREEIRQHLGHIVMMFQNNDARRIRRWMPRRRRPLTNRRAVREVTPIRINTLR